MDPPAAGGSFIAGGYADTSFFRRLFKRLAGLTPGRYRRLFRPVVGPPQNCMVSPA